MVYRGVEGSSWDQILQRDLIHALFVMVGGVVGIRASSRMVWDTVWFLLSVVALFDEVFEDGFLMLGHQVFGILVDWLFISHCLIVMVDLVMGVIVRIESRVMSIRVVFVIGISK